MTRRLSERLKDLRRRVRRDADSGVADFEAELLRFASWIIRRLPIEPGHTQHHRAAIGELHGVAEQVDQHLPELSLVADHERRRGRRLDAEFEATVTAALAEHRFKVTDRL